MILLNYDTHWEVTRVNWTHEPESSSTGDSLGGDYDMNCNTRIVKHHSIISTNFNTIPAPLVGSWPGLRYIIIFERREFSIFERVDCVFKQQHALNNFICFI